MIPSPLNPEEEIDPLTGLPKRAPVAFELGGGGGAPPPVKPAWPGGLPALVPTATPGFPLAPGQLPEKSVSTTGEQRSHTEIGDEHREQIDAQKKLISKGAEISQDKVEAREKQGRADVDRAAVEANRKAEQAKLDAAMAQQRAEAAARADRMIADKTAESERRVGEMEKASKPTTYWEDKGFVSEILSHILTGLSDRSHAMAGKSGPSPIAQMYAAKIQEDKERKLAAFENSKEFLKLAKEDQAAAIAAKKAKLLEIAEQHSVNTNKLASLYESLAARNGVPEAQAKAAKEIAEIKDNDNKALLAARKDLGAELAAQDERVANPVTTVTRNFGGAAPAGDLPKPEQGVLRKDGKGYHEMPNMPASRMENINKQLQSAGQINDEIQRYREAGRAMIAAKQSGDSSAVDRAQKGLDDAAERLGRVAAANKIIEGKDENGKDINIKGIIKIPIPFTGETKRDDLIKQVYAPGFVRDLEKDIRENAISSLNTAGVPRAQALPAVDDYAPEPPPYKGQAVVDLINAIQTGGDIVSAAAKARAAGIPAADVDGLIRRRRRQ